MQLQDIFIFIILSVCVHQHTRAIPVQEIKGSPRADNGGIKRIQLVAGSQACIYSSDCPPKSQCVSGVCECIKGWTSWKGGAPCAYEEKAKWTAFLLSFFLGSFGADWFYLARSNTGYIVAGVFKILVGCGCCGAIFRACSEGSDGISACFSCISALFSFGSSVWWLVDWIRILADAFPDGNGAPLYS